MAMTYDEKLDLIISELAVVKKEVASLKGDVISPPALSTGLYRFVKPETRDISKWPWDEDMGQPDAEEAFQRALHGVNWRGGHLADQTYEEAWAEIEALKAGDQTLISKYMDLDPEFAGFALLTNLFSVTKWDGYTFGMNAKNRKAYAGYTIQSFMDIQMAIRDGGGSPSGA